MRFLELKLENINSLKGKHEINFKELAKESDLFAITGPTGSGKSSILHALCMALYGQHPKGLNAKDIVTTGMPKARIELTFENAAKTYQVIWECQVLKKDGTPRKSPSINRVTTDKNGPREDTMEELLGLTYDQFTKVCILNQGQFSHFLTASFKERKDLLERLLENKNLKELAITLRRSLKEVTQEIEYLQSLSENSQLLGPEELQEIQHLLKKNKENIKKSTDKRDYLEDITIHLSKLVETLESIVTNSERVNKEKKLLEEIRKEKEVILKEYKIISLQIDDLKEKFKKRRVILEEAIETKTQIAHLLKTQTDIQKNTQEFSQEISRLKEQETNKEHKKEQLVKREEELNSECKGYQLDQIKTQVGLLSKIDALKSEKEIKNIKFKHLQEYLLKTQEQANRLKNDLESLTKELQENTPEALETARAKIRSKREEQQKLNFEYQQLKKEQNAVISTLKELKTRAKKYKEEKKELSSQLKVIQGNFDELKKESSLYILQTTGIELLPLQKSDTCPLCEQHAPHLLNKLKEEVAHKSYVREDFKDLEGQLNHKKEDLLRRQTTLEQIEEEREQYEKKEQEDLKKIAQMNELLEGHQKKNWEEELSQIEEKLKEAQEITSISQEKNKQLEELRNEWKKTKESADQLSPIIKDLEENIKVQQQQIPYPNIDQQETAHIHEKLREREATLKEKKNCIESIKEGLQTLEKYSAYLTQSKEKEANLNKELTTFYNLQAKNQHPDDPAREKEEWEAQLDHQDKELSIIQKKIQEKEVDFSKKESSLQHLREQREADVRLLNLYIPKLLTAVKASLLCDFEAEMKRALEKAKGYLENEIKRDHYPTDLLKGLNQDVFKTHLQELNEYLNDLNREKIIAETKISENEKQSQKRKEIEVKKKRLEERFHGLSSLSPYIDKDKFRDFALEMMEVQLLNLANVELLSLAEGRYRLLHGKEGKSSELLVLDLWNGGRSRKVSTLSGGETFLLSLGLALGLSELTRGQTQIDSFFIDEGFGSLDEESIGQVLDCLLKMESKGKQIGIISHVTALTQQIPIRLNLKKNHFGEAKIQLY